MRNAKLTRRPWRQTAKCAILYTVIYISTYTLIYIPIYLYSILYIIMLGTAIRCHSELKTGNVKAKNCNGKKGAEAAKRLESFSLTEKQIIFPLACPVFFYYRYKCICCRYIYKMYSQIYMNFRVFGTGNFLRFLSLFVFGKFQFKLNKRKNLFWFFAFCTSCQLPARERERGNH